jgi:hypothetical protein
MNTFRVSSWLQEASGIDSCEAAMESLPEDWNISLMFHEGDKLWCVLTGDQLIVETDERSAAEQAVIAIAISHYFETIN